MNKKRIIWLVPVFVMAFAMSACKSDDDGGGDGIGPTLNLSGDVYNKNGSLYNGNKDTLISNVGGSGTIRGGKLTFTANIPNKMESLTLLLIDMDRRLGYNVFSPAGYDPGDTTAAELVFANLKKTLPNATSTMEEIRYIWVDRDCEVKGKNIPSVTINGISVKVPNYTLPLKKGWNAVSMITMFTIAGGTPGGTLVIGTGDSENCKWVFE